MSKPLILSVFLRVTLASAGQVKLKDGSLCVDSAGANDQSALKAASCTHAASQNFLYDEKNRFVELSTNANFCWEDFWGDGSITLFDKTDPHFQPDNKHFHWDATTGRLTEEGTPGCLTATAAGQPIKLARCTGAANQQWVADWSPAPSPPAPSPPAPGPPSPDKHTCAKMGCIAYKRGLPCQCNSHCHKWNNCCSDFDKKCKKRTRDGKSVFV